MKAIIKKIVIFIITIEARLVLLRYKPKIIAITGTVGKTTAKDMIHQAMKSSFNVRKTQKSLNSEFGVPLTVLGHESGWNDPVAWLKIIFFGFIQIFYFKNYPDWLILEVGIDRPGDMERLAKWLKPNIAIFTAFGKVPVHVEYFDSPEAVLAEKAKLMEYVREDGAVILNADDEGILRLKSKSRVKVYTFGIEETADITASNATTVYVDGMPSGISFKINEDGNVLPVNLKGVLGNQYIYPSLIAFSVAYILEVTPVGITQALSNFTPPPGRMNLIKGKNDTVIIDDSYNASPIAVQRAIEVLSSLEGKKIIVLGDMLEIGKFSNSAHEKLGELIGKMKLEALVTVGVRSETMAEAANRKGMAKKRIFMFRDSESAIETISALQQENPGAVILVKGSQGTRTEKIVKEIMLEGDKSSILLVRQEKEWLAR